MALAAASGEWGRMTSKISAVLILDLLRVLSVPLVELPPFR
jgi:hypothetical protein